MTLPTLSLGRIIALVVLLLSIIALFIPLSVPNFLLLMVAGLALALLVG